MRRGWSPALVSVLAGAAAPPSFYFSHAVSMHELPRATGGIAYAEHAAWLETGDPELGDV